MSWQLQTAEHNFSQLVRQALEEGPQTVTRDGEEVVVVLSSALYHRLTEQRADFKDFLRSAPDLEALGLERDPRASRRVEL